MTAKNDKDPDPDPLDSGLTRLFGSEPALRYNAGSESVLRTMLIRSLFKQGCGSGSAIRRAKMTHKS